MMYLPRFRVPGYWLLVSGYSFLVTGCRLLVRVSCFTFLILNQQLVTRNSYLLTSHIEHGVLNCAVDSGKFCNTHHIKDLLKMTGKSRDEYLLVVSFCFCQ